MNERIALVANDASSLAIIVSTLESHGYQVNIHTDARNLLSSFTKKDYALILADLRLPVVDGEEFLDLLRQRDADVPFVFFAQASDLDTAIKMVRQGASDFLIKPIHAASLQLKVEQVLESSRDQAQMHRLAYEKTLLEMEINQLLAWRAMYAAKDTSQTEQLITVITRTVNAAGGYMWLNLLKSLATPLEDGRKSLPDDLINLILESTIGQKRMFDFLTYLSRLDSLALDATPRSVHTFVEEASLLLEKELGRLCPVYQRPFAIAPPGEVPEGSVVLDLDTYTQIITELIINAIKYSPPGSAIRAELEIEEIHHSSQLKISLRNQPRELQARKNDGSKMAGIPYEYSERVFDLFYTIDAYPNHLPEEEWSDGAGLYISRKLLKRQNAWLKTVNGVDYSSGLAVPFVRFTISIPIRKEQSDAS